MFTLTGFARVKNSFPALVYRPNSILYQVLTESPYFATIFAEAYIVVSFYNQYMYDIAAVW